ncbi:hypothetical protein Acr_21g0009800 [Actinidia rufa]|uniref:Myb/SANT-like domain-containing protein n=1 Tax=Actinidia rufa TaxID=165716 RepID=A0A7J0GI23_9ERIC|nr:hypothetical protein Acr_21g0009800 [Actinidia rufa]
MDGEGSERQPKQERLRTRWTSSLDKIFADLVVEQIQQGNRTNNVFDKKTWNLIRDEFNRRTDLHFNNNQLRKHLDVLRTRYYSVKSSFDQNDFVIDDSCCIGFDLWEDIGAHTKSDATKGKECPIYDQLCTIFADSGADGKYAQSSHYEELHKSLGTENPTNTKHKQECSRERKRKRSEETVCISGQTKSDQEINETMAKALSDMLAASKLRAVAMPEQDDRFNITNCIKALDEIEATEGIDSRLYFAALDLFEDPNLRETFVSLKSNTLRLTWLQGKCGSAISN